jgi:hypothetical protein
MARGVEGIFLKIQTRKCSCAIRKFRLFSLLRDTSTIATVHRNEIALAQFDRASGASPSYMTCRIMLMPAPRRRPVTRPEILC